MDYRRNFQPGGTFFFTLVTYHRYPLFENDRAFALLLSTLNAVKIERPFATHAWVVLPDHLHMIWALPPGDCDFSGRWSKIKSQFTRQWLAGGGQEMTVTDSKRREQRRGVWQPKFFEHTIRDEDDYINHVEYIHFNPVKHGLVEYPKDWQRSSFHEFVRRGIYPLNWCSQADEAPRDALSYQAFD